MGIIWSICRRDLIHFLSTPLAWMVLAVWSALVNAVFYFFGLSAAQQFGGLAEPLFVSSLWWGGLLLTLIAPAITMSSFTQERSQGTLQLLYTVPISDWQLLLGKCLAAWGMLLLLIIATLVQPIVLWLLSDVAIWQLSSGYLGLVLCCACYAAIGVWISLLVESPMAAYIITFGIIAVLQICSALALTGQPIISDIGQALGVQYRLQAFIDGDLQVTHIAYFIAATGIALLLGHGVLAARRLHG